MNEIVWLAHYGVGPDDNPPGRGSGRYPKDSGKNPRNGHGGIFKFFQKKNKKTENKKNISLNRGPSEKIYDAIKNADPKKVNNIVRNLIKNEKMISEEQIKKLQSLDDEWFDLETKSEDLYNDLCIKYSKDVDAQMKKDGVDPEDKHRIYWEEDIINKDPEMIKINNKVQEANDRYKKEVEKITSVLTGEFGSKKNGDRSVNDIVRNVIMYIQYEDEYLSHAWFGPQKGTHGPGSQGGKLSAWRDPLEYNRNDYISHYGRKGMKWYQHIFGKEEKDQKSLSETVSSNTNKTITNMSNGVKIYLNYKKTNSKRESPKISMTDDELSRAIRRIEMEKKYRSLTEPKKKDGYDRAMAALGIIGSISASAASAAAIVTAIYNSRK